jgi:hypothetical protein
MKPLGLKNPKLKKTPEKVTKIFKLYFLEIILVLKVTIKKIFNCQRGTGISKV